MTENIIPEKKKCSKCDKKIHARGLCSTHYSQVQVKGELGEMRYTGHMDILDRLEHSSERVTESGCQIWTSASNISGYGIIGINNKTYAAHRVSYGANTGEKIPEGIFVCHKCDNPSCINIKHLFLGTNQDNVDDMVRKGRNVKGTGIINSKLTNEQVVNIRLDNRKYSLISAEYNIVKSAISAIKNRKAWKHVP